MCAADKPEPDACAALKNENSSLVVAHHRKTKTQLTPIIHWESNRRIKLGGHMKLLVRIFIVPKEQGFVC